MEAGSASLSNPVYARADSITEAQRPPVEPTATAGACGARRSAVPFN